ncbi:pyocin knob domain-containing S74 family peptidase [uncultured Alistipes sp.]|uniref:pyocin knob domain-containing S74 family peptidase n=1 Tax=uncultured Alistipes sp. TaxID=538949 RepID=UPI0025E7D64C|nr:pyocin knob domain-containing S74 family peptidase [uncultured Alistipes sp.]
MQWRTQPGATWGAWRTLLDEANYAATLDGRYMSFAVEAGRDYVNASLSAAVGKKAHEGYIEFWDSAAGGWFNFKLGWLEAAGQVKAASFIRNGGTASQFLKADGSVDGTAYVNKAGDTLTGTLTAKRDQFLASGAAGIDMNNSDITRLNGLWFADEYNSAGEAINFYVDGSVWSRLGASGGTLYFNPSVGTSAHAFGHKVWHAGNDGDGSGLDADKLDGLHSTAFARCDQWQQVDLNTVNGFGFMMNKTSADATTDRHYPIQEAGLLIYGTAAYSSANQIYGSYYSNRWFARGGGWSTTSKTAWREFAFLDSNVASASKLATARTLWGQSFDGSGNVSGDMTGVGKITTTTLAIATSYDHTWSDGTNSHPWYGYDHRYHNTGVYSTTISDFYGLTLRTSQGNISMNAIGNVGIGIPNPLQKLHVDGNVLVSGEAYYRTEGRAGTSWNNGYGALSVGIMNNSSQTPLLVAYRYGDLNWTTPHANRLFAMELLNSGSVLRFGFGGAAKFYFEKDGTFHTEKGLWASQYVSSKGASASSDIRLKYGLEPLTLTLEQIAAAPAVRYRWRDTGEVDLGSTAQYWLRILSEGVRIQPNGFYGMAYDKIALVSAILLARHALGVKNRVDNHETRIQKIEQKINRLNA